MDRIETGVFAVDLDRKISYWNYGAEEITGFLSQDVLGRPCSDSILLEYDDHNPLLCMHQCPLENTRGDGARREAITYVRHRSGHVVSVRLWTMALKGPAGEIVGAVKVFSERVSSPELSVADAARGRQQDLDIETGIPSRAGTESFLREQIEASEKQRVPCGVIAIRLEGLDGFRHAHGMEASSAILREVAFLKEHRRSWRWRLGAGRSPGMSARPSRRQRKCSGAAGNRRPPRLPLRRAPYGGCETNHHHQEKRGGMGAITEAPGRWRTRIS